MNQNEVGTQELGKEALTPRTEAAVKLRITTATHVSGASADEYLYWVDPNFARGLERELATAHNRASLFELVRVALGAETQAQALEIAEGLRTVLEQTKAQVSQLKNELAAMTAAKAAAEAETDAFMEYHEQEMQHVYGIRQAHGTAVVAIQVDRQQFLHARSPERLEEMVKLVTIQTLEALLAGTPGREVFDRLTRELVRQRSAAPTGE